MHRLGATRLHALLIVQLGVETQVPPDTDIRAGQCLDNGDSSALEFDAVCSGDQEPSCIGDSFIRRPVARVR